MPTIHGKFADQDSYVLTQQVLTANNNQAGLNVALVENDHLRATPASLQPNALTMNLVNPVPSVSVAATDTIGAALGNVGQFIAVIGETGNSGDDPPCFTRSTLVTLASGNQVPIADVLVGGWVNAINGKGNIVIARVIGKTAHLAQQSLRIRFEDGRETHTNNAHRYWEGPEHPESYTAIQLLNQVFHWENEWQAVQITERTPVYAEIVLYNLEIEKHQTYLANGDAVHNLKRLESQIAEQ